MVSQNSIDQLMLHYMRSRQDMDTRRTRKNGWNEILTAAMGKLPANWPFLSMITDPRLRTSIIEKNARLINAKLRGRLVPRNGGSVIKAKVQNALLDFQWDYAHTGGSMIAKVAQADLACRYMGSGWGFVYWDAKRNTNELKVIDPRDIGFDGQANHIKNARWCQVREYTTWERLEERGYKVSKLKRMAESGEISDQWKSTNYESIVKANRGIMDRTGEYDDLKSPLVEIVTEWKPDQMSIFLPRIGVIIDERKNPYKHGKIPVAQLKYYPLFDDIYGESDAEYVLSLQRAINATLCGFIDEMTISMRPPLKVASSGVRTETIEYGPGAQWVMDNPNLVTEMQFSPQTIANFNATYPALVAAFNTAMGDQSMGVSNQVGEGFNVKTATEVKQMANQQNNRDQSNQLYLSEFLEDIMMMWTSNNKQYLFDDPAKHHHIVKVLGQDDVKYLQGMGLADKDVPDHVMNSIQDVITQNPNTPPEAINELVQSTAIPKYPVVTNPNEQNPAKFDIHPKLEIKNNGEADLYLTEDDFDGEYDYIPDVSSMASGANQAQQQARENALQLLLNPTSIQLLQMSGTIPNIKDIMIKKFEDAGYTDAESLFMEINNANGAGQNPQTTGGGNNPTN